MKRIRRRKHRRKRVQVGAPDPSLTATSGVAALAELVDKLDVAGCLDRGIGAIKQRARGPGAGELSVGLAQSQLLGGDALLVALDRQRADVAAAELSAVPGIASTTAGSLARRFDAEHLAGIEAAAADLAGRAFSVHERMLRFYRRWRGAFRNRVGLVSWLPQTPQRQVPAVVVDGRLGPIRIGHQGQSALRWLAWRVFGIWG